MSSEYRIANIGKAIIVISLIVVSGCRNTATSPNMSDIPQNLRDSVTPEEEREYQEITLGEDTLRVENADTLQKITLGLSYRDEIGADGMLFDMPQRSVPTFWMKGMLFDLDMVWIDCGQNQELGSRNQESYRDNLIGKTVIINSQECLVVDVTRNVPAPAEPLNLQSLPTYSPQFPVTHVLEMVAESI